MNNMRGAVMIAYPAYHGLPPYEGARVILEGKMDFNFHKHNDYDVSFEYKCHLFISTLINQKILICGLLVKTFSQKSSSLIMLVKMKKQR